MAKDPAAPKSGKTDPLTGESTEGKEYTPNWDKMLYTPDRIQQWVKGDITLQQLHAVSGPEMLEMAIIGFQMYENGRYDEARTIFEGLSSLDPKESYYLTALGAVHLAQENLTLAEQSFNSAIELNPKELASYVNRGEVYLRLGKMLEAAQDFKRAVDLDPTGKDPLVHRARVLAAAALEAIETARNNEKGAAGKAPAKPGAAPAKPAAKPAAAPAAKAAPKKK